MPTFLDSGIDLIISNKDRPRDINCYHNCPIRWIPMNLWSFTQMFDTIKMFPGMQLPSYKKISKRFLSASNYFEAKLNKYQNAMIKEK